MYSLRIIQNFRSYSTNFESLHRSLVKIRGDETADYLQGLITNDINHLSKKTKGSLYTMFLNTKGRVLYDAIVYKLPEEDNTFYIECDNRAIGSLERHLKMFRVRRKIEVNSLENQYKVWALFFSKTVSEEMDLMHLVKDFKNVHIFKDTRAHELGYRVITSAENNLLKLSKALNASNKIGYKYFRYSLGVGEGLEDHPSGNSFPLECNCDYLHGVSFHKGCYIGQELTARTHHTGMVRKRLMPLQFIEKPTKVPSDAVIVHEKVNLGRLRGVEGDVGLALLRTSQALEFGEITVGDGVAKVNRPNWWPMEAAKLKSNAIKS